MIKKTVSFTLIILLLFLIYQFCINMIKTNHYITYYINNGESFTVDEKYIKEDDKDYYLIKVTNGDKNFVFKLDNIFNKQKQIVEDIEVIEQNGFYCIGLNLVGKDRYSFPECERNNVVYSYNSVKNDLDFSEYIKKLKDNNIEKYSKESVRSNEGSLIINRDYFDANEIIMVYDYKQMTFHYPTFSRKFSFSSLDNYKNTYGALVGNYYVVPRLTSLPTFGTLLKYDVIDGIKKEIDLPMAISKQTYINGVHDDKLYLYDSSNKRQFEIDPYNDTINIVGTVDEEGITYVNGEKQNISVYDLDKETVTFQEKIDDFSSIEYDSIYLGTDYAVYSKNGYYYKVYKDFLDVSVLLFNENDIHNVIVRGDNIYFVKNDTIYKYNKYGTFAMIIRNEFIYNYDNIFDVYLK